MLFKVIACDVLTREVGFCAARSPHTLDIAFTAKGEHNVPANLRALLQKQIDEAAAASVRYDAVLLVYGLCGNSTVGLVARNCPLVIPRAHDCTTLFLGSKEAFQEHFGACPSQAWTSVGYSERGDAILSDGDTRAYGEGGMSFAEMVDTYGEENARYLLEALTPHGSSDSIPFIDVPETHIPERVAAIEKHIASVGKTMRTLPGDITLVRDLLRGDWANDRFLIVPPGRSVEGVYDYREVLSARGMDYPISAVDFTHVSFEDGFWKPRLDANRQRTLPANFDKAEATGRIANFAKAGGLMEGAHEGYFFNDSDVFKIMEGAAEILAQHQDKALDAKMDELIKLIGAAQEEDGYLYTARTIDPENAPDIIGRERWDNIRFAHELYNVGHLYEAAAAHYRATGKRSLLAIALKNADLVCSVFGPDRRYAVPGHPEIEMGLVQLYRITGERRYLDTAHFFIEQRGRGEHRELFGEYSQDHAPLVDQTEPVGHAVRAAYFYAGAADVAALTNNHDYREALVRLWECMVNKKMYITGGIGACHDEERFGDAYELPNDTAYAETCAAIASVLWNHRMFLLSGDARYIDVLERTLYNGFLAGVSISGDEYFYVNPLASDGRHAFNHGVATRQPWFDCSCCPTNSVRFLPSLPGYVYSFMNNIVYVNLFVAGRATLTVGGQTLELEQETGYPWSGKVRICVSSGAPVDDLELRIRIPGWAGGCPVPSELYRYLNDDGAKPVITCNGQPLDYTLDKGYAVIQRKWCGGEVLELELNMKPRYVLCHENVAANRGRVAVERGPLVYCAEEVDNTCSVLNMRLLALPELEPTQAIQLPPEWVALTGKTLLVDDRGNESLETLTLVPYFSWGHRGTGEMAVWLNAATPT